MQQLRDKMTKESINDHQMSQQGGTFTEFFKCGRCGKRKCMYNQVCAMINYNSLPVLKLIGDTIALLVNSD